MNRFGHTRTHRQIPMVDLYVRTLTDRCVHWQVKIVLPTYVHTAVKHLAVKRYVLVFMVRSAHTTPTDTTYVLDYPLTYNHSALQQQGAPHTVSYIYDRTKSLGKLMDCCG